MDVTFLFMKRFFYLIAMAFTLGASPGLAESEMTEAQEALLEQYLAPVKTAENDLSEVCELLRLVRNGKVSAGETAPEVKQLLDSIEINRKAFMEMKRPDDDEVAEIVSLYMRWNGDKLVTYTDILIQLSTELLNKPDTDAELAKVLKNCFVAPSLHSLSEYSSEDLAVADSEIQILKQFSDCAREFIRTLNSISNKDEADAAAPGVRQLLEQLVLHEKQVRTLSPEGKSKIHQEIIQTAGYSYGFPLIMMELEEAIDTISDEHEYFESSVLKSIFDEI